MPPVGDLSGAPGLALALRKLNTVGTLMHATAHPDDENNAMLALYARSLGMRVALVSATRGDGGQNEIGPELFDALGILRTEELLAAHQFDGAEQYFTRAVDFGYSFSPEETLREVGQGRRFSATSSGISGRCGPTSSSRWASTAPAAASTTRPRR